MHPVLALALAALALVAVKLPVLGLAPWDPRVLSWLPALAFAAGVAFVVRRARAPPPRRVKLAATSLFALLVVHALLAPFAYELQAVAHGTDLPDGGRLSGVSHWGFDPFLFIPFATDYKHRVYVTYDYARDANVSALTHGAAERLAADGWRVSEVTVGAESAYHGPGTRAGLPLPVTVGDFEAERSGLHLTVKVGRWHPACCQLTTDPDVPVRLRLMVEDPRTSGV